MYVPIATPEEIKIYQIRATKYADLATYLRRISVSDLLDKQVISTAETFANECDTLAKQWAKEWRGGL
jgi:hypothetical protein